MAMAKPTFSANAASAPAVLIPISLPVDVDERAAGVAGVDGRVGLDHVPERHAAQGRELRPRPETIPRVTVGPPSPSG